MNKYYHFTSYNNLESIGINGLVPQNGIRCQSIGDKKCAVFFSNGTDNATLLYLNILNFYQTHTGKNGKRLIEVCKKRIKTYRKWIEINKNNKKIYLQEINKMIDIIEKINNMMKYTSFNYYIEDGVYLTFSDIPNVIEADSSNCYTYETIPPEKIRVVILENKFTGEILDNREAILNYFLSMINLNNFKKIVFDFSELENLKKLIIERQTEIKQINSHNYSYKELRLSEYLNYTSGKIKKLQINNESV